MKVLTSKKFVAVLKLIESKRKTEYISRYPYNLGYCHADDSLSFDCWNLLKAVIWSHGSIAHNHTVGNYARQDTKSGLGDWTGRQMLDQCSDVSSDFKKLIPGELLLTYEEDHAGAYVGDFTDGSGVVNVIECTTIDGENGVITSYIDGTGKRYAHKGGNCWGQWGYHGRMPWIDYGNEKTKKYKSVDSVVDGIIAGDFGTGEERKEKLYRFFQNLVNKKLM